MIKGYENKRLKLNTPMRGMEEGRVVNVKTDKNGIPLERYWRDREKDAKTDGCVTDVTPAKRKTTSKTEEA